MGSRQNAKFVNSTGDHQDSSQNANSERVGPIEPLNSAAKDEFVPPWIVEIHNLARAARRYLKTHKRKTTGAATADNATDRDDGLYGVLQLPGFHSRALVRTTVGQRRLIASALPTGVMLSYPPFEQVFEQAMTILKEESQPQSTRYAAELLLENLVLLHDDVSPLRPGLLRDGLAFFCGMLFEQMQSSQAQRLALSGKSVAIGRKKSIETRSRKSIKRIEQFRSERDRCAEAGYTFSKRDACRKIAEKEIEQEEPSRGAVEGSTGRTQRIESRAKGIEKQLRKRFPADFT